MVTRFEKRKVTRMLRAIHAGDVAAVIAALDDGADPNGVEQYVARPLQAAVRLMDAHACDAITELLLAAGADPNRESPVPGERRPVFAAADHGHDSAVRMLIAVGGFPRDESGAPARGFGGGTLLAHACDSGLPWLAERALAEGCRVDDVDVYGATALHHAARVAGHLPRVGKDTAWFIDWLLARGASLEHQRREIGGIGGSALHWAVGAGDEAAVQTLVDRGADLEARTTPGQQTPVFVGVREGALANVRLALARGADPRVVDASGWTLLHAAAGWLGVRGADGAMVELLLAAGADRNVRNNSGQTAHERALLAVTRPGEQPTQAQARALESLRPDRAPTGR